jgi:hypothetical protein
MAHFYGSIQGNRGEATRMGSKDSGIHGYVQGHGSRITSMMNCDHDRDVASIVIEPGYSNYVGKRTVLAYAVNIDAIVNHADNVRVGRELDKARAALAKASEIATKLAEKS